MAHVAQCLYCFDVLESRLRKASPRSLPDVYQSWADYIKHLHSQPSPSSQPGATSLDDLTQSCPLFRKLAAEASRAVPDAASPGAALLTYFAKPLPADLAKQEYPLFITWNTRLTRRRRRRSSASASAHDSADEDNAKELRGCIGTFEPNDLAGGLRSYALIAALQDSRFRPIALRELPDLSVSVTLLSDSETCADCFDWTLGKHGIRIGFLYRSRFYNATYLPDVAVEQGWTKEETLASLVRKAGWTGAEDTWQDLDMEVLRYEGLKTNVDYDDYAAWRDWAGRGGCD